MAKAKTGGSSNLLKIVDPLQKLLDQRSALDEKIAEMKKTLIAAIENDEQTQASKTPTGRKPAAPKVGAKTGRGRKPGAKKAAQKTDKPKAARGRKPKAAAPAEAETT